MTNRNFDSRVLVWALPVAVAIVVAVNAWPRHESHVDATGVSKPTHGYDFNVPSARKSVVFIKCLVPGLSPALGSGFLVSEDGLIYTNRHVIKPDQPIRGSIVLVGVPSAFDPDELDFFRAEVVHSANAKDQIDFAVLKVAARPGYGPFAALPITMSVPELASSVAILGFPFINDDQRVLAFNKGSLSATRVVLDERTYYQTDAAFNPGNSGGPLLNVRGEAIGIVTKRKANSAGMGYALQLKEVQTAAELARTKAGSLRVEPGPLDPRNLPSLPSIPPEVAAWNIVHGEAKVGGGMLSIHNNGDKYWIATKNDLPENFQIVMNCQVEFLRDRDQTRAHEDSRRSLYVRFGAEDIGKDIIMDAVGTRLQFQDQESVYWQEKKDVSFSTKGCPDDPFVLTIRRQQGIVTVAVDEDIVFRSPSSAGVKQPIKPALGDVLSSEPKTAPKQPTKLSIGGRLSRLNLGAVSIMQIEPGPEPPGYRPIPKKGPPPVKGPYGPPVTIPANNLPPVIAINTAEFAGDVVAKPIHSRIADAAVGGNGRFLVLHLPQVPELAIFDVSQAKIVRSIPLAEADAKFAVGLDKVVVALPRSKKVERWDLLTGLREQSAWLTIKEPLALAVMGSASRGPVLIGAGTSELVFLDVHNLRPLVFKRAGEGNITLGKNTQIRASADGTVFAASGPEQGITTLVLSGNEARGYVTPEGAGHAVPGPESRIVHSALGSFGPDLKPLGKLGRDRFTLPAQQGSFALRFDLNDGDPRAFLHLVETDRPVAFISRELTAGVDLNDRGSFPADKRVFFIPRAKVIVTIPNTNDKLVLHRFDADDVLEKSTLDYLYVASVPPIWGRKGSTFRYPMSVESRTGGLTYEVVAGPPGLEVSKSGLVSWPVPGSYPDHQCDVVIAVSDKARQTVQHAFKIALRDVRSK